MSDRKEVDRLMTVLRTAIRLLGLTNREIERRLELTPSYLSRLFGGAIELKVEHVVAIARAIGMAPAEFFALAYPSLPEPPSESFQTIRTLLRDMQPPPGPPAQPSAAALTAEEIEKKIQESVRQALREMASGE